MTKKKKKTLARKPSTRKTKKAPTPPKSKSAKKTKTDSKRKSPTKSRPQANAKQRRGIVDMLEEGKMWKNLLNPKISLKEKKKRYSSW